MRLYKVSKHVTWTLLVGPKVPLCHSFGFLKLLNEVVIEDMAEGPVTQVMDKCRNGDIPHLSVTNGQCWLQALKLPHEFLGQIRCANTVLKSTMDSWGKHLKAKT